MRARRRLGVAVLGFGWMGQAHARSCIRIPLLFEDRSFDPVLVACADRLESQREAALGSFGFQFAVDDWRAAVDAPGVDAVIICAPNMFHEEMTKAAAAAGRHVFCEKPAGAAGAQTARMEKACRDAGVVTGVGYNYRFAPLVRHAADLIDRGDLGAVTNYRGRFFSMYGADPQGVLSWRYDIDRAGPGATSDILSHSIDLAMMLNGPITRVVGTGETFIKERPLPSPGGTHYDRGDPGGPVGVVTNEDYFGALAVFANGSRGTFEASRTIFGPESQMAFDVHGTEGAVSWNLETMNELRVFLDPDRARGYTTVRAGERHPYQRLFVPGDANSIGFEDLVAIEDYEFLAAVSEGRPHSAGLEAALDYAGVQAALLQSWETGAWTDVVSLRID